MLIPVFLLLDPMPIPPVGAFNFSPPLGEAGLGFATLGAANYPLVLDLERLGWRFIPGFDVVDIAGFRTPPIVFAFAASFSSALAALSAAAFS